MNETSFLKRNSGIIVSLVVILCIFLLSFVVREKNEKVVAIEKEEIAKEAYDYSPEINQIIAKSFVVYDLSENEIIFSYDEHRQLPLASVAKLMSGLVVLDVLPASTIVRVSLKDIQQEGDSGLIVDEKWQLKNLLDFSLISSSNDGISALTRTLDTYQGTTSSSTIQLMNQKSKDLGLQDTFFINSTGLDIDTHLSGAYSSAYDIAMLIQNILKSNPVLLSETKYNVKNFRSLDNVKHTAVNTDAAIKDIPNLIASKTGFTDLAGGNLAIAFDAGFAHPVAIVLLGSTIDGRFTDMQRLVNITLQKLSE